ncbi:NifU family protein [Niabella aquatica]
MAALQLGFLRSPGVIIPYCANPIPDKMDFVGQAYRSGLDVFASAALAILKTEKAPTIPRKICYLCILIFSVMIKTGNPVISIYTEMTPNPETMKFVANKLLYPGKSIDFPDAESAKPSPLATELFGFPFIKAVFIASNFVTLTKTADAEWMDITPSIRQFLKDYLEEGKAVINEDEIVEVKKEGSNEVLADDDDVVKRIKELLENYVKPAVEMDGGAIQFKSYNEGVVNLMMQGSCSGCPSSMITLKAGIEGMMKRMIPEVKEVVAEAE